MHLTWSKGKHTGCSILSLVGGPLHVRYGGRVIRAETRAGETISLNGSLNERYTTIAMRSPMMKNNLPRAQYVLKGSHVHGSHSPVQCHAGVRRPAC